VGLAVCLTLIGFFYTEELWRGKRAWENCKRALQAQGVKLDWADYIPAPVPENENFFGVPEMQKWFVGRGETDFSKKATYTAYPYNLTNRFMVAEVSIGQPGKPAPGGASALRWDDPASKAEAARLLTNALGSTTTGPVSPLPYSIGFMLRRPAEISLARIFLQCNAVPTEKEMQQFLPDSILCANAGHANALLKWEPDGNGLYRVTMPRLAVAADYLAWSDALEPQFALIRQTCKRPFARMNGQYAEPIEIPIPNFITERILAQTLASRAQCHFLQGQSGEALRDLTLLHDSCRPIMESNNPMTLVSAMIDVAVRGLYANTIADGLRLHAWREPELEVLQEQLKSINVLPPVRQAFEKEPASICRTLETTPLPRLMALSFNTPGAANSWKDRETLWLTRLVPRGWVYQNMVTCVNLYCKFVARLDSASQIVFPDKVDAVTSEAQAVSSHPSPYTYAASLWVANFQKAVQTTAYNQTLVNQTLIACALERYHLAHGAYPETLDALMPRFITAIPHDVIGGQPPHYRRAADGTFMLYSIGWDGRDHNGVPGSSSFPFTVGDWVWPD
jgi:hypothetical protein